jgi:uncharacterized protein (TIGR02118 family)
VVRFIVLWKNTPSDIEAFEQHSRGIQIPLGKKLPGARRYTLSRSMSPVRCCEPYFQIAELDFDDMTSLQKAFQSPEGRATSDDVTHMAAAFGVDVQSMIYELEDL